MSWLSRWSTVFAGLQTSSADPGKLLDYADTGLDMAADLRVKTDSLRLALDDLRAPPSEAALSVPPDLVDDLADLVADWQHLDEFVGDVGRGFARAAIPGWGGNAALLPPGALPLPNWAIRSLGAVGFANRDEAIAAAHRDASALRNAIGDSSYHWTETGWLSDRVARGAMDPAYAVALLTTLGPDQLVGFVDLIEQAYLADDRGRPAPGWGREQLAPFGLVLSTAMDTLPGLPRGSRLDPDNAALAVSDRLDAAWVERFVALGRRDDPTLWNQSLLMSHAVLPTQVLLDAVGPQLAARLGPDHLPPFEFLRNETVEVWGGHGPALIETNLLDALANNGEAALRWLSNDDTGHATNAQALLHYDPGFATTSLPISDDALDGFAHAGSRAFESAFTHEPPAASLALFTDVVDTIAHDGSLSHPAMAPGLAHGARTHFDTITTWINDDFDPGSPNEQFLDTSAYLRELFREDDAARVLRQTASDYLTDRLADIPLPDDGRALHLTDTGRVLGVMTQSDANAIISVAEDHAAHADVVGDQLDYVLGRMPIIGPELARTAGAAAGEVNDLLDALDTSLGEGLTNPAESMDEAGAQARQRLFHAREAIAIEVARAHYDQGEWTWLEIRGKTSQAVREAGMPLDVVDLDFFEGSPNDADRPMKRVEDMTPNERRAFVAWLHGNDILNETLGTNTNFQPRVDYHEILSGIDNAETALVYRT